MIRPANPINHPTNRFTNPLSGIRQRMANALVGHAVSLAVDAETIIHGNVTDVLAEPGIPQIIVDGMRYNFDRVLTNVPAALSY